MNITFTNYKPLQWFVFLYLLCISNIIWAQDSLYIRTKSYNSYPAPLIEDNSFLIEEAFNQGAGVVQFISTCYFEDMRKRNLAFSFTHEIPLKDVKHQFSYTVNYFAYATQFAGIHGLGDIMVNYRYEWRGKDDVALITPRFSLILPSGDFSKEFGLGAWGGQFNLPISKMISRRLVTHYNAGLTFYKDAKYDLTDDKNATIKMEHDLTYFNAGASIIWMPVNRLNLMLEYVSNFNDGFEPTGKVANTHQMIVNPGFRYAFDKGKCQIVPGFSMPVAFESNKPQYGAFIYLSIEPNYGIK